jgi:hypothetical protein
MDANISQNSKELIRQNVARLAAARKGPQTVVAAQSTQTRTITAPEKEKVGNSLAVFILLISFLPLGIMFFMSPKGKYLLGDIFQSQTVSSPVEKSVEPKANENYMLKEEVQQFVSSVNQRLSKIEDEVRVWKQRTWMLAVANNENSVLCEKMDAEFHRVSKRGFVKVDENWKLVPVPKNLPLTEEQKKDIGPVK